MDIIILLISIGIALVIAFLLPVSKSKDKSNAYGTKFDDWETVSANEVMKNAKYVPYTNEEIKAKIKEDNRIELLFNTDEKK